MCARVKLLTLKKVIPFLDYRSFSHDGSDMQNVSVEFYSVPNNQNSIKLVHRKVIKKYAKDL